MKKVTKQRIFMLVLLALLGLFMVITFQNSGQIMDMENYNRYKNKSITEEYALGVSNQNTMELERISNNTFSIKNECEYYLNMHPDIREVLINLNVDDDFYANNIQYSNITRII